MSLIDQITPPHIKQLVPYASAKRELFNVAVSTESLWLNANESPYVNTASGDEVGNRFNRYPDFQSDPLLAAYAKYAGVDTSQLLVTRGADEGIELLVRTFCTPAQDAIVINPPTYGMYKICATTFNVKTIEVPLTAEYQLDVPKLTATSNDNIKLVFICSPNNPTGELMARGDIETVLRTYQDRALVVLDEAYIEFSAASTVVKLLADYPNLVILRTLSKAFGLAGIRCGFTIANRDVIDMLKKVIAPYPIPAPVEQIAVAALSPAAIEGMKQKVQTLNQQKTLFIAKLSQLSFVEKILNSDTNFVLLKVTDKTAVFSAMNQQHIYIRDPSSQPTLAGHLRITIGSSEQMQAVLNVLEELDS